MADQKQASRGKGGVNIRLYAHVAKAAREYAAADHRTINNAVNLIVEEALAGKKVAKDEIVH